MDIKTTVNDRATKVKTTVDSIQVAEDTYVYRAIEETTTTRNGKSSSKTQTVQGVCKAAGLTKVRKGELDQHLPAQKGGYRPYPVLLTDEFLAEVKRFGYAALAQRNFKGINRSDFFDYLAEGGSLDNLVLFNSGDHTFYRIDGTFLPTGVVFTYMNESMCSRSYDLEKVVEILSKRDDITFIDASDRAYGKSMDALVLDEPKITPVPYYNADCGSEIRFAYTPTEEEAKRIDEIRKATERYIGVSQVIIDEDFLGIKCAKREQELVFARDEDEEW